MATATELKLASLAVAFAAAACWNEPVGASGSGDAPTAPLPPASTLLPPPEDPLADEDVPSDAGAVGLEFDPVTGRLIIPEAGTPPPRPLRGDSKLAMDHFGRDEQVGLTLQAAFVHRDLPGVFGGPEVSSEGVLAAAKATAPRVVVTLTALGRMKLVFESRSLPLPYGSELRARHDKYGHLVFWPGASLYRIIPPGALRTVIGERRVDVTPLSAGGKTDGPGGKRLEHTTRRVVLDGPLGKLSLELAMVPEAGLGGPLLCRTLVETLGLDPSTPECKPEEVPLHASFDWLGGGGVDFTVSSFERRTDIAPGSVLVPPPGAERTDASLPQSDGVFVTRDELRAMRKTPLDITKTDPAAPPDGFIADNGRDQPMELWLDGLPIVSVPALGKRFLVGAQNGRYNAQWRTFLGDRIEPPEVVEIPGISRSLKQPTGADAGP
ncbi:MAG: hypothetical protein IPM79_12065 [Polyangiaceae bacterium]|jgi:hypothetical protein|nr:hypothetical protein [Polyangiaceae bacterium]MBK8938348.1 hypothetical protein [Polyangiaceae bacterium]